MIIINVQLIKHQLFIFLLNFRCFQTFNNTGEELTSEELISYFQSKSSFRLCVLQTNKVPLLQMLACYLTKMFKSLLLASDRSQIRSVSSISKVAFSQQTLFLLFYSLENNLKAHNFSIQNIQNGVSIPLKMQ